MAGTHTVLLTLPPIALILIVLAGVENAAVKDVKDSKAQGASKRLFMPASDASNFFKHRGRRSPKTYEEYYAEQRMKMAANERRREHLEEQNNEYENYLEEERDDVNCRTGVVWITVMFLSAVWTLILTAPIHYRGSIEQYERTRQKNEQWREFHYDGQYPRYPHHRHYV